MQTKFSKKFVKQYDKADSSIKLSFGKKYKIFLTDMRNPQLHNHPLTGAYKGYWSINITGDWRAIYFEKRIHNERIIIFEALGTHSQLYG